MNMNMRFMVQCLPAVVTSVCLATIAIAADVQATANRVLEGIASDEAKAAKLVEAAGQDGAGDEFAIGLLRLAIDHAMRSADNSAGLQAGIDALDALGRKAPDQAVYCRDKLALLCQEAYRRAKPESKADAAADVMKRMDAAGDASAAAWLWPDAASRYAVALRMAGLSGHTQVPLDHKIRVAKHFVAASGQLEALRAAGQKGDTSVNGRLVMLYLTGLNDPAKAAALLTPDSGEALRTYVPLVLKDAEELPGEVLNQLCDWYGKSLAAKAEDFGREMLLRRARGYAEKAQAKLSAAPEQGRIKPLDEQLAGYSYVNRMLARNRNLDLLAMTDIDRDATRGKWKFAENAFVTSGSDDGSLRMPVNVEGSYQLSLQLAKTKAAKDIYVSFPVGDRQIRLHIEEHKLSLLDMWRGRNAVGRGAPRWDRRDLERIARSRGIDPNALWLRAELSGVNRKEGSWGDRAINPQYDKRTWVPYKIDIAVKVADGKAVVGVSVGAVHKLNWSGNISSLGTENVEQTPITVRFDTAGLAVRSVRLTPRGAAVSYAYEDRPGPVPPAPAAATSQAAGGEPGFQGPQRNRLAYRDSRTLRLDKSPQVAYNQLL